MTNEELANFFIESNNRLEKIILNNDNIEYEKLEAWKHDVVKKLNGSYKIKMNRLEIITYSNDNMCIDSLKYNSAKTILRDMYFKYNTKKKKTKTNIEIEKLLKAREENIDFELELSTMVTGDNSIFPYRTSSELTDFFQNLGYNFKYSGETRRVWVKDRLDELNIIEIHSLLSQGLFKKKYFKKHSVQLNSVLLKDVENHPDIIVDDCINKAKKEFEGFIKNSIYMNDVFDLSTVLDMHINIELLFDNEADTEDKELNKLIEEAKDRFLNRDDKQVALEKLWAAFERLKTYFSELEKNGKDKKQSAIKLIDIISNDFDKDFLIDEFNKLTKIGNSYRIRHHEKNKRELSSRHTNYFFFRMMTVIDLCLMYVNNENEE